MAKNGDERSMSAKIYEHLIVTYARKNQDFNLLLKVKAAQLTVDCLNEKLTGSKVKYTVNAVLIAHNKTVKNAIVSSQLNHHQYHSQKHNEQLFKCWPTIFQIKCWLDNNLVSLHRVSRKNK